MDLQPQQVGAFTITDAASTRGGAVHNLWPNPSSEALPPAGADVSRPEWAGLTASASAFAGSRVRQLTAPLNGQQLLGDLPVAGGTYTPASYRSLLGYRLPCAQDDEFFIRAKIRVPVGAAGTLAGVGIYFLDANQKIIQNWEIASNPGNVWTDFVAMGPNCVAPAGALYVLFVLFADSNLAAVTAQFDAIVCTRRLTKDYLSEGCVTSLKFATGAVDTTALGTGAITAVKLAAQDAWTVPTFLNSWLDFGAPFVSVAYYKDFFGTVHLRGHVKSGSIALAAFTLPAGYRPSATLDFACDSNGSFGECRIDSSGNVIPRVGNNTAFSLDGITFDTR